LFFDGWSYGLLYERLAVLYAAHRLGVEPSPARPRPELGDYAAWLARETTDEVRSTDIGFWRQALADYEMPRICAQMQAPECTSSVATHMSDARTATAVEAFAARCATTPFVLLLTTFALVLGHLVDHTDLLIASNDANRHLAGTEQMMG